MDAVMRCQLYGTPPAQALDEAIAAARHRRSPESVQRILQVPRATPPIPRPSTLPRGTYLDGMFADCRQGKTYAMKQLAEQLAKSGHRLVYSSTIGEPDNFRVIQDKDEHVVEVKQQVQWAIRSPRPSASERIMLDSMFDTYLTITGRTPPKRVYLDAAREARDYRPLDPDQWQTLRLDKVFPPSP